MSAKDDTALYARLGRAIVLNAVNEYKTALEKKKVEYAVHGRIKISTKAQIDELEEFFNSDYCSLLCGFDVSAAELRHHFQKPTIKIKRGETKC